MVLTNFVWHYPFVHCWFWLWQTLFCLTAFPYSVLLVFNSHPLCPHPALLQVKASNNSTNRPFHNPGKQNQAPPVFSPYVSCSFLSFLVYSILPFNKNWLSTVQIIGLGIESTFIVNIYSLQTIRGKKQKQIH